MVNIRQCNHSETQHQELPRVGQFSLSPLDTRIEFPTMSITVGTGPQDYIAFRCFQQIPVPGVAFKRQAYAPIRSLARVHPYFASFCHGVGAFYPTRSVDLFHSSNAILLNPQPWVVSFESSLPRIWDHPRLEHFLFERLASVDCRSILPMSKNALLHFKLRNQGRDKLTSVLKKTHVVYPGIEDDATTHDASLRRKRTPPYRLLFIGNDFLRKGGAFACEAYAEIRRSFPVELTVISTLQDTEESSVWIQRMRDLGITHLKNRTSSQVREQLSLTDLLLLPTQQDSFGFSIVEAMATGVPAIASAVEAIPEIIDDRVTGRLIALPLQEEGRLASVDNAARLITNGLVTALSETLSDPAQLTNMGLASRQRYEHLFHPAVVGQRLQLIYDGALSS